MDKHHLTILLTILVISILFETTESSEANVTGDGTNFDYNENSIVLSRRKRFLTFPDGSSFQMVFCTQNQGYIQIGDIIVFGNTAALAWELPSDPKLFYLLKEHHKDHHNRRQDVKHIYYLGEKGEVLSKVPYHRKPIVNPAFAKRSIDNVKTKEHSDAMNTFTIKKMHEIQKKRSYLNNLDAASTDFHREGRKSFYAKLEKFLEALGWRGRECVLRLLCENGKGRSEQGTFLEEIFWATFTLPKGSEFSTEEHKGYDVAHNFGGECSKFYPDCEYL